MVKISLIQTVKSLDQTGPGQNGENLEILWQSLTQSSNNYFHAPEGSALRWLLKSMNGASQGAETMRRYPLTWAILNCVFRRIPLFSLAKSLADRKFVSVLQQTLRDISSPKQKAPESPSAKRKRSAAMGYNLDELNGTAGCLATGQAVFSLLKSLLSRLGDETIDSRSKIGAEHIKSLFSTSAAEAAALSSAALAVCNLLLTSDGHDLIEGRNDWITTISAIWDLHLQSADDTLEVATHLFNPTVSILAKTEGFPQSGQDSVDEAVAKQWSSHLSRFMHRNLILPARSAFLQRNDLQTVTRALDVAVGQARLAAPVLFFLAAGAPEPQNERDVRRGNATWMRQIFQAVESQLRNLPDRNRLMEHILGLASSESILVDVEDLRIVCRDYGMSGGQIDWDLVAQAAVCNSSMFQVTQEDDPLLKEVCQQSTTETDERKYPAISNVVGAIQKSFSTRRNPSGFLKLWFKQLCCVERFHHGPLFSKADAKNRRLPQLQSLISRTPWFALAKAIDSPSIWIESETSPPMLLEVIEWLQEQESSSCPHAFCTFADSVGRGLRTETFTDAVGTKLLDFISTLDQSRNTALKWRVVSRTFSWASRDQKAQIWGQMNRELSEALSGSVKSASFFEAYKCCLQIWDSVGRDEVAFAQKLASLVETSTDVLFRAMESAGYKGPSKPFSDTDRDASSDYDEDNVFEQYLAWCILGSSRFLKMFLTRSKERAETDKVFYDPFSYLFSGPTSFDTARVTWADFLANEVNLNDGDLSNNQKRLAGGFLEQSRAESAWPGEKACMAMQFLSKIPFEALVDSPWMDMMKVLEDMRPKMKKNSKTVTFEKWKAVLDFSTKVASIPKTQCHIDLASLLDIADALSNVKYDRSIGDGTPLEMVERFFVLASTAFKETATSAHRTGDTLFLEGRDFVLKCDTEEDARSPGIKAFRITLIKALIAELRLSRRLQGIEALSQLLPQATNLLAKLVASVLGEFAGNPDLLSSQDRASDLRLLAAVDAASALEHDDVVAALDSRGLNLASIHELDGRSKAAMADGDLRGWKIQIFMHKYLAGELESATPTSFPALSELPTRSREGLLKEYVDAVIKDMGMAERSQYLMKLIRGHAFACNTDGQILAIEHTVNQLLEKTDMQGKAEGVDLAAAHSQLIFSLSLARHSPNTMRTCRVLQTLLEKKPQAMGQWNVEITLSTVAKLAAAERAPSVPFPWLCRLVGVVIKKHRLRLEGHYHLLLTTMQALLRMLVGTAPDTSGDDNDNNAAAAAAADQETRAHAYGRLVSLICEPTAGSVSRSQHQSALDSATDVAKRSAGRHMYLVLMQYVKLQLEAKVGRRVLEELEPAMNTIFDITPPEVRKILNDAMDASGRAILREMYKRYVKFGKWSGV
ncbi:Nucleolar pre-ribosomal-associated protein 2 [Escovopsis weberi]|uniref:Nucleolar pre-ribosomal-associated protein 2 n=1 Tax=Escovopsis weberi TaxID=150374 RepID=A0A0M9VU04_ESCWE|nr:Nucleolar pre-ribosomal-associated protein 2 [Escovopsis weberi]